MTSDRELRTRYAAFLSHKKSEAAAEARYIHDQLELLLNVDIFLDSSNLLDLRGLFEEGLAQSEVFVLIASTLLNIAYLLPIAILALMPPEPGSIEVAGFKRPGGAPALTVIPLSITAIGCFVLFFGVNAITDFISPVFGGRP